MTTDKCPACGTLKYAPQCTLVHCSLEYSVARWKGSAERAWATLAEHRTRADAAQDAARADRALRREAEAKCQEWREIAMAHTAVHAA